MPTLAGGWFYVLPFFHTKGMQIIFYIQMFSVSYFNWINQGWVAFIV